MDVFRPSVEATSELYLNGEKVGVFSQLHPRVALKNEILLDTFLFESYPRIYRLRAWL